MSDEGNSGQWTSGVGTEFGEVDNPAYGQSVPNWNIGAFGDRISGWHTQGVALPNATPGEVVEVRNPQTGEVTFAHTIDKGPAAWTGADIDMTAGTRSALGLPVNYKGPVDFRMVSGAPSGFQFDLNHDKPGHGPIDDDVMREQFLAKSGKYAADPDYYWNKFKGRYKTAFEQFKALNPEYTKANLEKFARSLQSNYYPDQTLDEVRNRLNPNQFTEFFNSSISNLRNSIANIWGNATASANQIELGGELATQYQPPGPNDAFELAKRDAQFDPNMSDEQRTLEIDALNDQQRRALEQNRARIPQTRAAISQTQAGLPGPGFQGTAAGKVTSFIGQSLPYIASGSAGPLGAFAVATQMTASSYAQVFDQAVASLKEQNPGISDTEALVRANAAATQASAGSGESGLSLALVDVPVAGPLIARMVAREGLSAATFSLANVYAKVQENMALKTNVDPRISLTEGLLDAAGVGAFSGLAFGFPKAIGEIGAHRIAEFNKLADEILPKEPTDRTPEEMAPFKAGVVDEGGEAIEPTQKEEAQKPEFKEPSTLPTNEDDLDLTEFYSGVPWPDLSERSRLGRVLHSVYRTTRDWVVSLRTAVALSPHTGELIIGLDKFRQLETFLQGKLAALSKLYNNLRKRNPNLSREIDTLGRTIESGRPVPPSISPEAKQWLMAANNGLYRDIGRLMKLGGFKVKLPEGGTRDFIGAPDGVIPFPRIMRPDVADILDNPMLDSSGKFTPAAAALYKEGSTTINLNTGKPFFEKPQDLLDLARQRKFTKRNGPIVGNLEMARTVRYPSFFYTYSPESMLGTLKTQATEISRLMAFGQKLSGSQDLFDKTLDAINKDLTLSQGADKHAAWAVEELRKAVYGLNTRAAPFRLIRGVSSFSLAGSIHTSSKIAENMMFNNPVHLGLFRTLRAMQEKAFHPKAVQDELRSLGLSNDTLINLHDDPYAVTSAQAWTSNLFTGGLRLAGHAMAQDIGKGVTMRASRLWIVSAIKKLQADPNFKKSSNRIIAEFIERRGFDPREFTKANIPKELEDRFVIETVNDLQTAYRPEDYPAWAQNAYGAVMFQFGHWSYNAARLVIRDSVLPFAKAVRRGDTLVAGRYGLRLMSLGMAAVGASELWRQTDKLFGRQSDVATAGEILTSLAKNDPQTMHLLMHRLILDVIGSPVIGTFGDVANLGASVLRGSADTAHAFNPFQPAAVGWMNIFSSTVNKIFQQGGHLSHRQEADFRNQALGLVSGYYDLANTLGAPLPGHEEAIGRRKANWVRSRLDVFYDLHPESDGRRKGPNLAGNAHTPYLQNINEDLVTGNSQKAIEEVMKMQRDLSLTPKELKLSVHQSLISHLPIPGGKTGPIFRAWAKDNMPPKELNGLLDIDRQYRIAATKVMEAL